MTYTLSRQPLSPQKALERLQALCSKAEYCTFECRQRLTRWRVDPAERDAIVDALVEGRWVDDARYAEAYVQDKVRQGWGRRKMNQGLRLKGIASESIRLVLAQIPSEKYLETAIKVAAARLKTLPADMEARERGRRVLNLLLARGYETDLALQAIRAAQSETPDAFNH